MGDQAAIEAETRTYAARTEPGRGALLARPQLYYYPAMATIQDRSPPSVASVAIDTAIISGLFGYFLGQAQSIGLFGKPSTSSHAARLRVGGESDQSDTSDADAESGDEDDSLQDLGELKSFAGNNEECKLVLVVRTDLGMGKGM